ncbi:MAG: HAD-IA family hydrolase [Candidatus Saccharibacteria bacterium]|nr:HAD-IA family hydrolase [Candidatus Saccharibacteria bacterium]
MSHYKAVIFDYHGVLLKRFRLQTGVYSFAQELHEDGYQVAVLSNLITPIAFVVKRLKHLDSFETRIISCDVGMAKPNPLIYKLMLERLSLRPEECIFVDNRPRNLAPAAAMGMGIVHAKNTQQIIHDVRELLNTGERETSAS